MMIRTHTKAPSAALALAVILISGMARASEAGNAIGTLTLYAADAQGHVQPPDCPAILITSDAVLVAASCFDPVRFLMDGDPHAVEGRFTLEAHGTSQTAAMLGKDIPRDHVVVRCGEPAFDGPCSKAKNYCQQHFASWPIMRNACLFDSAFYARTFIDAPQSNVAVVYLNRRIDVATTLLAEKLETWPEHRQWLTLTLQDGSEVAQKPQRLGVDALSIPSFAGLRLASAAWLTRVDGAVGLVALPSHFENLPLELDAPVNYVLTRIDHHRGWIEATLLDACLRRRRLDCSLPQVLAGRPAAAPPGHRPEPTPEPTKPEPTPQPPQAPKRPRERPPIPAHPPAPKQPPSQPAPKPPAQGPKEPGRPTPNPPPPQVEPTHPNEAMPPPEPSSAKASPHKLGAALPRRHAWLSPSCNQAGASPWLFVAVSLWARRRLKCSFTNRLA